MSFSEIRLNFHSICYFNEAMKHELRPLITFQEAPYPRIITVELNFADRESTYLPAILSPSFHIFYEVTPSAQALPAGPPLGSFSLNNGDHSHRVSRMRPR